MLYSCSKNTSDNITDIPPSNDQPVEELEKEQKIIEIEEFLNTIRQEKINKIHFSAYKNVNQSYSFLYFIDNEDINIMKAIVDPKYTKTRPGIKKKRIDWIVIHDTGNNDTGATGLAHSNYITKNNPSSSWHYTVDEHLIYQHIPDNEVAWHAGDGKRETGTKWYSTTYNKTNYGGGNMNGIGIETCVYNGIDYLKTMKTTAKLAASLLYQYDLTIDALKMHYDFNGKSCANILIKDNYFPLLKQIVSYYLEAIILFHDVEIKYQVQSTDLVDENGFIKLNIKPGSILKYQVTVTYQKHNYIYDYETVVI